MTFPPTYERMLFQELLLMFTSAPRCNLKNQMSNEMRKLSEKTA